MKRIAFLLLFLMALTMVMAQMPGSYTLDGSTHGTTVSLVVYQGQHYLMLSSEKGASGKYPDNSPSNLWITIDTAVCEGEQALGLYFNEFDVDPGDTLFVHDGPNTTYLARYVSNNNYNSLYHATIYPSTLNQSGKLTIRFKTNGDGLNGKGFSIEARCREKCETVVPVIDSVYYKTKNGVITDTSYTRMVMQLDTNWSADSTSYTLDTNWFRGVHLCLGEGVIFSGHGEYTNDYAYGAGDYSSLFEWNFGNGHDTSGIYMNLVPAAYSDLDCYDVTLKLTDIRGCRSLIHEVVKVRIAQNPVKTIYNLNPMCTTDSAIVNIGYSGGNATIGMQRISFAKAKSRSISCKTFLPDGMGIGCPDADDDGCFQAPIHFDDFPPGRTVMSAEDICSICINHEHSWNGDYNIRIICPTGQKAGLKFGNPNFDHSYDPQLVPQGSYGQLSTKMGIPYGGSSGTYDGGSTCPNGQGSSVPNGNYCDSLCNMFGVGMDYCFSRNKDYMLTRGVPANITSADEEPRDYFATGDWIDVIPEVVFDPVPAPYVRAGQVAPNRTNFSHKHPSDHEGKSSYYLPASDFHELIGCPLNGNWSIQVCDPWPGDNGWIFSWALDFCGISAGEGCAYQVQIDSVIWEPDSNYGDFDLGYWRGLNIDNREPTRSIISSHDTAGYFPIKVRIYDEFGCVWDTSTAIQSVWSPTPQIGDTLLICDVQTVLLDAKDRHTDTAYTFKWDPFGQITDTISTRSMMGSSTLYTVDVENHWQSTTCRTRDSVRVNINHQPLPNFDPGVYPLEGCEPYTIHFENTSQYGDTYLWVFGDGDSSRNESPTHTYGTGQYDFKYYVRSMHGCNDSLVYHNLVTVYSSPEARFSWEPMNPTVTHPTVTFNNLTIPQSDYNKYYWEIQYDRDNHISYHTLTDVNPTFEWETDGSDISGSYVARLIAMTKNIGPSGNVVECRDTVENRILLVNDFLQFPNAVTPNGDGVNDKFIIRNLIDGLGYPNNSLAIYDRWGKRVYYKENISREEDFWDPAADNIPEGTYFWRFTGKGYLGDIQRNGVVEVIK